VLIKSKSSVARISLAVALVLFFTGFFVMCACPGWYALAAGFAGVTVWFGAGRIRAWGVLWLVASLALTAMHVYAKAQESQSLRVREIKRRFQENSMRGTNQTQLHP